MAEAAVTIDNLRAAYEYAERKWHVFPVHSIVEVRREIGGELVTTRACSCGRVCGRPGKHPRTENGWKAATLEPTQIADWWRKWPDANIGVACGPSGLIVVDVDPRNNGDETFSELESRFGKFPATLTANTGGGGQHYFYDVSGVDGRFKGRVLGQGVELQASGQYVLVSPSSHMSGRRYVWDFGQEDSPVFPPAWLTDEQVRTSRLAENVGAPLDSILGVAFSASGMTDIPLGPDRIVVQCPWESEHSQGRRFDGSTIVFGPTRSSKWGWFHCSHAHCKERLSAFQGVQRMHEVLRALPEKAAKFAQERVRGSERELRRVVRAKWEESLVWDPRGERIVESAGNLRLMLENMPEWAGLVAYDESKDKLFWTKSPPGIPGMRTPEAGAEIGEHDWIYCAHWFSLNRHTNFKKETAADTMVASGHTNAHNSLTSYLERLRHDGKTRLNTWLQEYCGAEDTIVTRRLGRAWLISAVARAMNPGCQADHIFVLQGDQGAGKTSIFRVLGGEWYLSNLPRLDDKDARHILSGAWIVELGELAALKGAAIEKVKAFITDTFDYFRPPYGRHFIRRQRRCVYGATTNDFEFVHDLTGARRFWPVRVAASGTIDLEGLRNIRDLLWCEARDAYLNGEPWWIQSKDEALMGDLLEEQGKRQHSDPWEERIEEWCSDYRDLVSTREILTMLGVEPSKQTPNDSVRVGKIMMSMRWEKVKTRRDERSERAWFWRKRR